MTEHKTVQDGTALPPLPESRQQNYFPHMNEAPTAQDNGSFGVKQSSSFEKTSSNWQTTRSRLGLHPTAPIHEDHDTAPHSDLLWSKIRLVLREPFAEFWGVFIMMLFGDGSVAQVMLSTGETSAPGGNGFGAYQSISWG
jgi:aquaglyceroporin related protein, other eukaryote